MRKGLYKCEKCNDLGWILKRNDKGYEYATRCDCSKRENSISQWREAGINVENKRLTFNNFEVWNSSSRLAKDVAIKYYNNFNTIRSERSNSIIFSGQVGSGKTHLSIALGINFMNKKVKIIYMPYRDFIITMKQNILDADYYRKLITKFKMAEVLLIDDLFKGKVTESDINIMFEIINYRYINHLPLIISTELFINNLLLIDEAIGSRIYEMCKEYIVEIEKVRENNYRLRR